MTYQLPFVNIHTYIIHPLFQILWQILIDLPQYYLTALFLLYGIVQYILLSKIFSFVLMLVSAALGRVAGQGFYGVAQAAFYRFEALLYSAAASGEGYG